jgi:hypothetical protein
MEIPVRLELLDSDDDRGVKLWVRALDGSDRVWFKWYENRQIAIIDAENMRLVETPVLVSPSENRYVLNVHRKLLLETEISEEVLETHWHRSSNPKV